VVRSRNTNNHVAAIVWPRLDAYACRVVDTPVFAIGETSLLTSRQCYSVHIHACSCGFCVASAQGYRGSELAASQRSQHRDVAKYSLTAWVAPCNGVPSNSPSLPASTCCASSIRDQDRFIFSPSLDTDRRPRLGITFQFADLSSPLSSQGFVSFRVPAVSYSRGHHPCGPHLPPVQPVSNPA